MLLRLALIFFILYMIVRLVQSFTRPVSSSTNSRNSSQNRANKKEGDVTITAKNNVSNKKISKDEGEYVDYEDL